MVDITLVWCSYFSVFNHGYSQDPDESPGSQLLHDQVLNVIDIPQDPMKESASDSRKGWEINDPWRGDHVLDAWYFGMWTILNNEFNVDLPQSGLDPEDPWADPVGGRAPNSAR